MTSPKIFLSPAGFEAIESGGAILRPGRYAARNRIVGLGILPEGAKGFGKAGGRKNGGSHEDTKMERPAAAPRDIFVPARLRVNYSAASRHRESICVIGRPSMPIPGVR
jgi:hypothetical protein